MKEDNKARHLWAFCFPVLSVLNFDSDSHPKLNGNINLKILFGHTLANVYVNQGDF